MANPSSSSHIESFLTTRPPFFRGTDYSYWKEKMSWFLKSINLDLWDVIEDGPHIPSKLENRVLVPKPKQEWDELDKKKDQLIPKPFISYIMLFIEMNLIMFDNVSRLKKFGDY